MIEPLRIVGAEFFRLNASKRDGGFYKAEDGITRAESRALTIDLEGYTIFPGMVNVHDHLEMNHYPRTKFREKYDNAHQWGEDVNTRLDEPPFKELRAYPIEDRCFIGGLKNLLCGATSVIHHNPPYPVLFQRDFPVRVLRKYRWAHSLHFATKEEIVRSRRYRKWDERWYIHLAEGTDETAASEYQQLKAMGCIRPGTVLIHGVGITREDFKDAAENHVRFVVCPSTNHFLLGAHPDITSWTWFRAGYYLGSDSRLTANGDFLDEIRYCYETGLINNERAMHHIIFAYNPLLIYQSASRSKGVLPSDWFAVRRDRPLYTLHRADLSLIVRGGVPQIGDPALMEKFTHIKTVEAALDGAPKLINMQLARQIKRCSLKEPGLEIMGKVN